MKGRIISLSLGYTSKDPVRRLYGVAERRGALREEREALGAEIAADFTVMQIIEAIKRQGEQPPIIFFSRGESL